MYARPGTVVAALATSLLLASAGSAPAIAAASATPAEVEVAAEIESWYLAPPTCNLPTGCTNLPIEGSALYPDETLHVGVVGGTEQARTYLRLAIEGPATEARAGRLRLPLAGTTDGTEAPELAEVTACLALEPPPETRGSLAEPPELDCSISSPAIFDPSAVSFTVDLEPFLDVWSDANTGLALVPNPLPGDPATRWHLAFSTNDRPEGQAITAFLGAGAPGAVPANDPSPSSRRPAVTDRSTDLRAPFSSYVPPTGTSDIAVPPPGAPSGSIVDQGSGPLPAQAVTEYFSGGFSHPAVLLLPLALLLVAGQLTRVFTRPVVAER